MLLSNVARSASDVSNWRTAVFRRSMIALSFDHTSAVERSRWSCAVTAFRTIESARARRALSSRMPRNSISKCRRDSSSIVGANGASMVGEPVRCASIGKGAALNATKIDRPSTTLQRFDRCLGMSLPKKVVVSSAHPLVVRSANPSSSLDSPGERGFDPASRTEVWRSASR